MFYSTIMKIDSIDRLRDIRDALLVEQGINPTRQGEQAIKVVVFSTTGTPRTRRSMPATKRGASATTFLRSSRATSISAPWAAARESLKIGPQTTP